MASIQESALQLFYEEAEEHLAILEEGLLQMEKNPAVHPEDIDRLFRSAHTIKGSAGLMKLKAVAAVSHRLEDTLEGIRDGRSVATRAKADALLFALDQIRELIRLAGEGNTEPTGFLEEVDQQLEFAEKQAAEQAQTERVQVQTVPRPTSPTTDQGSAYSGTERRVGSRRDDDSGVVSGGIIKVAAEKIESMMEILGEITVSKTHMINELGVIEKIREEVEFAGSRLLREVSNFSERFAYALPEQAKTSDSMLAEFHELEFDRYDELNLFARTLQEITNDINEALRTMADFFSGFTTEIDQLDRMTVDMKERISEARTIQASNLFQRFTRSVRELSKQTGKPLELIVSGGETLIDRAVYDGLYDPLLHIVRNAVAHGFETPEDRGKLGKPAVGTIWLSAKRLGNTVEIEVRDDGRGIQFDKVRKRAAEKGFIRPDQEVSEQELIDMIFRPGFSTTETTDSTSGRGVGMNVVMDRLASLNGTIDIDTIQGQGTTMRLTLPLSLVIVNVIQFRVGEQRFVIPSTLVSEIVDLPAGDDIPEYLEVRGSKLPLVDLNGFFGLPRTGSTAPLRFAIVTQASGVKTSLLVEEIISQEDTVIKPFDSMLREMPFFSGSSISGDGTLRLVINPTRLLASAEQSVLPEETAALVDENQAPRVLIVDDSLSVRKYASMLLEAHGIEVLTANNGMDALNVLDENQVDFIITDLEMPIMHGYELLGELGRRGVLETIPVAVLTSRAGKQHQDKAYSLGASDYLIKPFEEESLLEVVRRNTQRSNRT